jgi:hypothetical protein
MWNLNFSRCWRLGLRAYIWWRHVLWYVFTSGHPYLPRKSEGTLILRSKSNLPRRHLASLPETNLENTPTYTTGNPAVDISITSDFNWSVQHVNLHTFSIEGAFWRSVELKLLAKFLFTLFFTTDKILHLSWHSFENYILCYRVIITTVWKAVTVWVNLAAVQVNKVYAYTRVVIIIMLATKWNISVKKISTQAIR